MILHWSDVAVLDCKITGDKDVSVTLQQCASHNIATQWQVKGLYSYFFPCIQIFKTLFKPELHPLAPNYKNKHIDNF